MSITSPSWSTARQRLLAPVDVHEQFVQVPRVTQASLPAPEDPGVRRTEPPTPLPNRLVGDGDAPLSEEIFGIAEAQAEPVVEPDGSWRQGSSWAYSASLRLNLTIPAIELPQINDMAASHRT
jgi:hypothetical protein